MMLIVVVENVARNMRSPASRLLKPRIRDDGDVGGCTSFDRLDTVRGIHSIRILSGISGPGFFRSFCKPQIAKRRLSFPCFVSLTLSPALCAVLLPSARAPRGSKSEPRDSSAGGYGSGALTLLLNRLSLGYGSLTRRPLAGLAGRSGHLTWL